MFQYTKVPPVRKARQKMHHIIICHMLFPSYSHFYFVVVSLSLSDVHTSGDISTVNPVSWFFSHLAQSRLSTPFFFQPTKEICQAREVFCCFSYARHLKKWNDTQQYLFNWNIFLGTHVLGYLFHLQCRPTSEPPFRSWLPCWPHLMNMLKYGP